MERREFLKIAVSVVAGGVVFVTTAQAAPLLPRPFLDDPPKEPRKPAQPAVTSQEEIDHLEPEEVKGGRGGGRGGRGRHRGWGRGRHLGWYRGRRRRRW
jgi:hypothetical protein